MDSLNGLDLLAVQNFRKYLQIPSVHPNINYDECIKFLEKQAIDIGLEFKVYRIVPENPIIFLTWLGREINLTSILLSSHMDVVPVFEDKWIHKPFSADIDENGNIYGRGTQDTKSTGIQYLEAIRRLKQIGFQPRRTVHVCFTSDEEMGSIRGIIPFIESSEFKKLNVGFALDEGFGGENEVLRVYYGERRGWKFGIHCQGQPGHGSVLLPNTVGEKSRHLLDKFYDYREEQKKMEEESGTIPTSINLTGLEGGVQNNVIPAEILLVFDTRTPVEKFGKFETLVKQWCRELGDVWIEDYVKHKEIQNTDLSDSNPFWVAFKTVLIKNGYKIKTLICPANTDSHHLRSIGIPALGFTPNQNTEDRRHGNNEFLNVKVFLDSIRIYEIVIPAIANV